jgi:hypothetical protein
VTQRQNLRLPRTGTGEGTSCSIERQALGAQTAPSSGAGAFRSTQGFAIRRAIVDTTGQIGEDVTVDRGYGHLVNDVLAVWAIVPWPESSTAR